MEMETLLKALAMETSWRGHLTPDVFGHGDFQLEFQPSPFGLG